MPTYLIVILVCAAAAPWVILAFRWLWRSHDFVAGKTRQRIALHLDDGESVRGVLVAVHHDCVVLDHAKALGDHVETPVDGEAVFPRARVAWLQILPPEASEPAV